MSVVVGALSLACWVGVLLHPARPWDLRPMDTDDPDVPEPTWWPTVGVVVPARNEAELVSGTAHSLAAQDYPGDLRIVIVDERSSDATGQMARRVASDASRPIEVITGAPLPEGWVGKVWGMEQGVRHLTQTGDPPDWILLTDADIRHEPESLRRLVADAVHRGVALESRMARLRCQSTPERLLVPPFVLFFFLLYPPRWANQMGSRVASAAGGCILVRRDALTASGGMDALKGAMIDDLALARLVKHRARLTTHLALSRGRVRSVRTYDDLAGVWTMVRRSAFTQLHRSWPLLIAVSAVLLLMFLGPLVAVVLGAVDMATGTPSTGAVAVGLGLAGWGAMAIVAGPVTREFGLAWPWRLALPVSGVLYGAMTIDSALCGPREGGWR